MNHPQRPPLPVIILVVLILVSVIVYFAFFANGSGRNGEMTVSGTIEAVEISISPEISGKVVEVLVEEGDPVEEGEALFRLDDTLLQAQRESANATLETARTGAATAQAALSTAQTQYEIAQNASLAQEQKIRQQDWKASEPARFSQPSWYFTREEQIVAATTEIDASRAALDDELAELEKVEKELDKAEFLRAEQRLANARAAFVVALDVYTRAQNSTGGEGETVGRYNLRHYGKGVTVDTNILDAAREYYNEATDQLDSAQEAYDELLTTRAARDVLEQRASVSVALERYYTALDLLRELQTGNYSLSVVAAQKSVEQAQAASLQALQAVKQAEAQVALIDVQIGKLTVTAPTGGVVTTRSIEPGEMAAAGSIVLTLSQTDSLTITVYVPEDRYGEISLGQSATVSVDSFPGLTFEATVVTIAGRAEFTPRNVQTAEGRKTTVFAIKLRVTDPEGKLKPGMPADVVFEE